MKVAQNQDASWIVKVVMIAVVASIAQTIAVAQNPGTNAVYKLNPASSTLGASAAFIDATPFASTSTDICATLYSIISPTSYPGFGTIIDARGINTTNSLMTCSSGTPWVQGATTSNPATILLPAGTIQISSSWVLPNGTRIIGEGSGSSGTSTTTIQACTMPSCTANFPSGSPLIQLGSSTLCPAAPSGCVGVSIEDLGLDAQGLANVAGILNGNSQELSYVNHVNLYQIVATGLEVQGNAQGSGPYSNIRFDTGAKGTVTTTTRCAQILTTTNGNVSTRGIHGLTCISNNTSNGAVLLDASNNSIEDVQIQGFLDGIVLGKNADAQSDILLNIAGSNSSGTMKHVIHICGSPAVAPCPSTPHNVSDLSILGVSSGGGTAVSIQDDQSTAALADTTVAMYVLGHSIATGGITAYSRFTTSPNVANWGVGATTPAPAPCITGSLFSYTVGASTAAGQVFVCVNNSWVGI